MKRIFIATLFLAAIFCLSSTAFALTTTDSTLGIVEITTAEESDACHIRYTNSTGATVIGQDGFMQVVRMRGPETPQESF